MAPKQIHVCIPRSEGESAYISSSWEATTQKCVTSLDAQIIATAPRAGKRDRVHIICAIPKLTPAAMWLTGAPCSEMQVERKMTPTRMREIFSTRGFVAAAQCALWISCAGRKSSPGRPCGGRVLPPA